MEQTSARTSPTGSTWVRRDNWTCVRLSHPLALRDNWTDLVPLPLRSFVGLILVAKRLLAPETLLQNQHDIQARHLVVEASQIRGCKGSGERTAHFTAASRKSIVPSGDALRTARFTAALRMSIVPSGHALSKPRSKRCVVLAFRSLSLTTDSPIKSTKWLSKKRQPVTWRTIYVFESHYLQSRNN